MVTWAGAVPLGAVSLLSAAPLVEAKAGALASGVLVLVPNSMWKAQRANAVAVRAERMSDH